MEESTQKPTNVIIAEDSTIVREGLRALLESSSGEFHVIAEATNGLEAIRAADKHHPDLILLDLSMPKMNGISAVAEIKRHANGSTRRGSSPINRSIAPY